MEQEVGLSIALPYTAANSSCTTFNQNFTVDLNIIVMCIRKKLEIISFFMYPMNLNINELMLSIF